MHAQRGEKKPNTHNSTLLHYISKHNVGALLETHLPWPRPMEQVEYRSIVVKNIVISTKVTNQNGEVAFHDGAMTHFALDELYPVLCKGVDHPHFVNYNSMGSTSTYHPQDINRPGAQSIYQHAIDTNTWLAFVKARTGIRLRCNFLDESIVNTVVSYSVPETYNFDNLEEIVKPGCHVEREKTVTADDDLLMLDMLETRYTGAIPHYSISFRIPEGVITPSENRATLKIFVSEKGTVFFINGFKSLRLSIVVLSDFITFVREHADFLESSAVSTANGDAFKRRRMEELLVRESRKKKK